MAKKTRTLISIELEDFLETYTPEVRNLALQLRDLVFEIDPEVIEQIDIPAHLLAYGYAKTYTHLMCVIILYKDYVNLGFPRGVDLPDPEGVLEGTGKRARHVKIRNVEQIESPEIAALFQASADETPRPE
ncbi:MAG TPA: DUF1801 domain-containing protein [Anaerolineales bacterium]|jgi:hypothetical protein|nr:DUF1801 domain-containing protein [Anaerolineales bacterium]